MADKQSITREAGKRRQRGEARLRKQENTKGRENEVLLVLGIFIIFVIAGWHCKREVAERKSVEGIWK